MPVYFIRMGEDGPVKIGYTNNTAQRRMAHYRTMLPYEPMLLGIIETDHPRMMERLWHRRFRHLRLRNEWYRPEPELLGAIRANATVVPFKRQKPQDNRPHWEKFPDVPSGGLMLVLWMEKRGIGLADMGRTMVPGIGGPLQRIYRPGRVRQKGVDGINRITKLDLTVEDFAVRAADDPRFSRLFRKAA